MVWMVSLAKSPLWLDTTTRMRRDRHTSCLFPGLTGTVSLRRKARVWVCKTWQRTTGSQNHPANTCSQLSNLLQVQQLTKGAFQRRNDIRALCPHAYVAPCVRGGQFGPRDGLELPRPWCKVSCDVTDYGIWAPPWLLRKMIAHNPMYAQWWTSSNYVKFQ